MNIDKENKESKKNFKTYFQNGMTAFLVVAAGILLVFFLLRIEGFGRFLITVKDILKPVIIGFVIAFLLNPAMNFFEKHFRRFALPRVKNQLRMKKILRGVCILLVLIIALFLISFLMNLIIPELFDSVSGMVKELPGQTTAFINWINGIMDSNLWMEETLKEVLVNITNYLKDFLSNDLLSQITGWMEYLTSGVIGVFNVLYNLLLGVVFSIYILASKEQFVGQLKKLFCVFLRPKQVNALLKNSRLCYQIFSAAIFGKVLDSAIVGLLCFIGMTVIGLPYAVLISVIVGVTNVIPFFGPYIGAIPSALLILFVNPLQCLYFIIFILILQQIDCNILDPRIVGGSVGLSAFWVLLACILFGGLFGIVGLLIGVPTTACIYTIVKSILEDRLKRKGMQTETTSYVDVLQFPLSPGEQPMIKEENVTKLKEQEMPKKKQKKS